MHQAPKQLEKVKYHCDNIAAVCMGEAAWLHQSFEKWVSDSVTPSLVMPSFAIIS